jgi:hypothetical protein
LWKIDSTSITGTTESYNTVNGVKDIALKHEATLVMIIAKATTGANREVVDYSSLT